MRVTLFVALVTAGFVVLRFTPVADYVTQERMVALFSELRGTWWAPLLLILLYTVLAPLGMPMTPLLIGGGAVFGFAAGALYNFVGMMIGGTASYYLARSLGRDFVLHVTRGKIRQAEALFDRHGFWPLVHARLMPIPYALANFSIALAGVRAPLFLMTTALGLAPAALIYTYFWARLFETTGQERWIVGVRFIVAVVLLNLVIGFPSIRATLRARRWRKENAAASSPERKDG